jgi:hypothetical protein
MEDDKKVLMTKTGRDREATGEVGGRPVFSGNGRFPAEPSDRPGWERGVDGEGQDARAGARDGRDDRAKNGIRAKLPRRSYALTEEIEVAKGGG